MEGAGRDDMICKARRVDRLGLRFKRCRALLLLLCCVYFGIHVSRPAVDRMSYLMTGRAVPALC